MELLFFFVDPLPSRLAWPVAVKPVLRMTVKYLASRLSAFCSATELAHFAYQRLEHLKPKDSVYACALYLRVCNLLPPQVRAGQLQLAFVYFLELVDYTGNLLIKAKSQVLTKAIAQTLKHHKERAVHFDQLYKKRNWNLRRVGRQRLDFLF